MAKEYTVKVFGKKTKYRKIGSKYYRIKKDGELAKDAATGLVLANLKNAAGSRLVSSPEKMLATVKSAAQGTNKRGQMGRGIKKALASTPKDDGGKAKLDFKKDVDKARLMIADGGKKALQKAKEKNKKVLNIIKKDASNTKTDSKPLIKKKVEKKVEKKKDTKPLQKTQTKTIKSTKTKALQNKPKQDVKKKVDKKKTESKLDSKGNYKGTNIKPTKLQLERLKKRGLA